MPNETPRLPIEIHRKKGRTLYTRYIEQTQAIRSNNDNSSYLNHILNTGHTYYTIRYIVDVIKIEKKGKHLNTLEKYHIHKISKDRLHMSDTYMRGAPKVMPPIYLH
jgi:hypothetical protein